MPTASTWCPWVDFNHRSLPSQGNVLCRLHYRDVILLTSSTIFFGSGNFMVHRECMLLDCPCLLKGESLLPATYILMYRRIAPAFSDEGSPLPTTHHFGAPCRNRTYYNSLVRRTPPHSVYGAYFMEPLVGLAPTVSTLPKWRVNYLYLRGTWC